MHTMIESNKAHYDKTIEFLKTDIESLRTGRISPSLVETIKGELRI